MAEYEPELGQMAWGNPTGQYAVPAYAQALVTAIIEDIRTFVCYRDGRCMEGLYMTYDDPGIPGIALRPYWWGDDDAPERALPNLECCGLRLRFYKWVGRGMTMEADWGPDEWCQWYEETNAILDSAQEAYHEEKGIK